MWKDVNKGNIEAKNKDRLIRRNLSKRKTVYSLYNRETVAGFPYEIYYIEEE